MPQGYFCAIQPFNQDGYDYAVKVLEEARQKIIAKASDDPIVDKVYEMMVVAFPMSKKNEKETNHEAE